MHCHLVQRRRQANRIIETMMKVLSWSKSLECADVDYRWTVHLPWTSNNDNISCRASEDWVVQWATVPTTGLFGVMRISLTKIKIEEDGIRNTVRIYQAALPPSTKFAKRQFVYTPEKPADERRDDVNAGEGQTTAEKFLEAPQNRAGDHIVGVMAITFDTSQMVLLHTSRRYNRAAWAHYRALYYVVFASSEEDWCSAPTAWTRTHQQKTESTEITDNSCTTAKSRTKF